MPVALTKPSLLLLCDDVRPAFRRQRKTSAIVPLRSKSLDELDFVEMQIFQNRLDPLEEVPAGAHIQKGPGSRPWSRSRFQLDLA